MTVFVSYSSRDRDAVKRLTQDLQDADEQVWLDQRLAGGEAWWRAILDQIRGCDVFIFALSQNSIESKPCQAELQYAQALGLPILPVQVGPVDSMSLNPVAAVQAIDYRHQTPNTGMRLIAALNRERSRRQPLPSPLPAEPPVPFEYLIRLYTTISNPDYLTPRDQAAVIAQLQVGLGEDGQHEVARNDIVMLLTKLHDREDATHRTRTDVEAVLASLAAAPDIKPPVQPPDASAPAEPPVFHAVAPPPAPAARDVRAAAEQQPPPPQRPPIAPVPQASPGRRAGALILDLIPLAVLWGIGYGLAVATARQSCGKDVWESPAITWYWCRTDVSSNGVTAIYAAAFVALLYIAWNWIYRPASRKPRLGQSLLKVAGANTARRLAGSQIVAAVVLVVAALLVAVGTKGLAHATVFQSTTRCEGPGTEEPRYANCQR